MKTFFSQQPQSGVFAASCICTPVCNVCTLWLNILYSPKITARLTQGPGPLHYTAHRSSLGNISKFWAKDEGYVQNWHFRYKTRDRPISGTKRSRAKVQSVYRNSCTAYRLVTNLYLHCTWSRSFLMYYSVRTHNWRTDSRRASNLVERLTICDPLCTDQGQ